MKSPIFIACNRITGLLLRSISRDRILFGTRHVTLGGKVRNVLKIIAGAVLLASSAFSQGNNPLITVDEFCHGSLVFPGGGGTVTSPCAMSADPGPGGLAS